MHIKHIQIENFRRFEKFECDFDPKITLLMGPNGSGKSSLLQAIFSGLGLFYGSQIDISDVRATSATDPGDSQWRLPVYPCSIRSDLEISDEKLSLWQWRSPAEGSVIPPHSRVDHKLNSDLNRARQLLSAWLEPLQPDAVPLFARFGAADSFSGRGSPKEMGRPFQSKQDAWNRSNSTRVDIEALAQWFQYNELRTLQEGRTPIAYSTARSAVLQAIHALDIKYIVRDNQLMVNHEHQGWRPWDQLSDGQKRVAAIFCEIALRCATLNSQLGERCVVDAPGIVLIDELDLHLHPTWQRSAIRDLLSVFPSMQFVVASHSPFLLQAAFEYGQVVDMRSGQFVQPGDTSIEDIAEGVMGVDQPQRGVRFLALKRTAAEYIRLLETPASAPEDVARIKAELDGHMAHFANDPASAAWLAQQREAAGL